MASLGSHGQRINWWNQSSALALCPQSNFHTTGSRSVTRRPRDPPLRWSIKSKLLIIIPRRYILHAFSTALTFEVMIGTKATVGETASAWAQALLNSNPWQCIVALCTMNWQVHIKHFCCLGKSTCATVRVVSSTGRFLMEPLTWKKNRQKNYGYSHLGIWQIFSWKMNEVSLSL